MQLDFISMQGLACATVVRRRLFFLAFLLICVVTPIEAHEGRPVFIELNAQQVSDDGSLYYQMRWKIPPVLSKGQEPVISLLADFCEISLPALSEQGLKSAELAGQSFSVGLSDIVVVLTQKTFQFRLLILQLTLHYLRLSWLQNHPVLAGIFSQRPKKRLFQSQLIRPL